MLVNLDPVLIFAKRTLDMLKQLRDLHASDGQPFLLFLLSPGTSCLKKAGRASYPVILEGGLPLEFLQSFKSCCWPRLAGPAVGFKGCRQS